MVQLARKAQLVLLELREAVHHESVLEVRGDQGFKKIHVVSRELAETVVQVPSQLTIAVDFAVLQKRIDHKNHQFLTSTFCT